MGAGLALGGAQVGARDALGTQSAGGEEQKSRAAMRYGEGNLSGMVMVDRGLSLHRPFSFVRAQTSYMPLLRRLGGVQTP